MQVPASQIPGLKRPDYLDGTLAGDMGLDPLNFVTKYSKGLRVVVPGADTTVTETDPAEFKSVKRVVDTRVEKFDRRGTEPIELLNIRIRVEILSEFRKFCQNSSEIQKFEDLSTFSKLFIEILRNSH